MVLKVIVIKQRNETIAKVHNYYVLYKNLTYIEYKDWRNG